MCVSPLPSVMVVRLEQDWKAEFPMFRVLSGMVMLRNALQYSNAEFPMFVKPRPNVTLVRL